ncbi:MAG: peptide chain release factor-like protein [Planctomycetes bacterium]|nr:peptide chain release factor-like protein [Planctomycetota bacterium]
MKSLGLAESEVDESFVLSRGPGGQHLQKNATCVVLVHRPTGVRVRCQESRSQGLNRFLARRRLVEKLEARRAGEDSTAEAAREKLRRQKRRRSRRARARLLADKRHHSAAKAARRAPGEE